MALDTAQHSMCVSCAAVSALVQQFLMLTFGSNRSKRYAHKIELHLSLLRPVRPLCANAAVAVLQLRHHVRCQALQPGVVEVSGTGACAGVLDAASPGDFKQHLNTPP